MTRSMTPEQARAALAAKTNRLAGRAVGVIRAGRSADELECLFDAGSSDVFLHRDRRHPRKSICVVSLLDLCYDRVGAREGSELVAPPEVYLALFRACHRRDCRPGRSVYAQTVFDRILRDCFGVYARPHARSFAEYVVGAGAIDPVEWALRHYEWHGRPEDLATIRALGVDLRAPGLLDECLRFQHCSPNSGETYASRAAVVMSLIEGGAKCSRASAHLILHGLSHEGTSARAHLKGSGVLERLGAAVDPLLARAAGSGAIGAATPASFDEPDAELTKQLTIAVPLFDALVFASHDAAFAPHRNRWYDLHMAVRNAARDQSVEALAHFVLHARQLAEQIGVSVKEAA